MDYILNHYSPILTKKKPVIINGLQSWMLREYFKWRTTLYVLTKVKSLSKLLYIVKQFKKLRKDHFGKSYVPKLAKNNNQYYFHLHAPSFPSKILNTYLDAEINKLLKNNNTEYYIRTAIIAITRTCPLRCEHCFEGHNMNGKENMTLNQLCVIIEKLQNLGVAQIQLSGGEPMTRLDDVIFLIENYGNNSDFLLLTSGYNFTYENALKLKKAGLKQVSVALDSFDSEINNQIKGHKKAFEWSINAIENAQKAGLLVSLSLCATQQFVTYENLHLYMNFAKNLGVAFVHILDPRMVGNYNHKNKELYPKQLLILEEFFLKMNYDSNFKDYPIIIYSGYQQRKIGCFGAANRFVYVDTNGHLQACPFCQNKGLNIFKHPIEKAYDVIRSNGCHKYETVHF